VVRASIRTSHPWERRRGQHEINNGPGGGDPAMPAPVSTQAQAGHGRPTSGGVPWWLYLLFCLSGISGLMYEVVWVRMLTRILGSTVYATSTVLAAFMAGLALGSFLIARLVHRARRPLVWYAAAELAIGLSAL